MPVKSESWWGFFLPFIAPMVLPLLVGVGMFFTLQSDLRHLEDRVAGDEAQMVRDVGELERRVHLIELETTDRLASIETKLEGIDATLRELNQYVKNGRD